MLLDNDSISIGGVGQRDIHKRQTLCKWQEQPCKEGELRMRYTK